MANAQVEKLKALGLRHGEKAVVSLAGLLCLLFLFFAVTKKTIELTPDQVASAAKQAEGKLSARQDPDDILRQLEAQGIKDTAFEKLVDAQAKEALNAVAFKPARQWVTPEPGAGLIRDTPTLIAATELYAYPGRGGALVYDLKDGERIKDDTSKGPDENTKKRRLGRPRRGRGGRMGMGGGSGMMGMGGGSMGMMGGMMGGGPPDDSPEGKKAAELKAKKTQRALAGSVADAGKALEKDNAKDEAKGKDATAEGPFKEITKGLRWVCVTGVVDHKKMRENWLAALKNPAIAHPNYKQLDVQRQIRGSDGEWGDWEDVDIEKNRLVLWNLPEEEEELTPDDVRIDTLVDPLPFLKAGYWERVHVASLVPKEKVETPKAQAAGGPGGKFGGMGGMGGMEGGGSMMGSMGSMRGGGGGKFGGGMMGGGSGGMGGGMDDGGGGGMRGMGGGGMGGGSVGGGEENTSFEKSESDQIMIRSLDFTVDPDETYRYRVRIVVYNPNYKREDVSPGVDTTSKELKGPWSEPTDQVTMPGDVAAYAMAKTPSGPGSKRTDQVHFQVVRWDPKDGVTVTRYFDAGPGEIVGSPATTSIPNSDGERPKPRLVDYNSHDVVVDTVGGPRPIAQVGAGGAPLDMPALSLLMRPDGALVVRNETVDLPDPVRTDMDETYQRELKESNSGKGRQSSQGRRAGGRMGGGRGGMMGGGGIN